MPNGYPYLLMHSGDYCQRCGEPLCNHEKEREYHEDGRYSYDYYCDDGRAFQSPGGR